MSREAAGIDRKAFWFGVGALLCGVCSLQWIASASSDYLLVGMMLSLAAFVLSVCSLLARDRSAISALVAVFGILFSLVNPVFLIALAGHVPQ